MSAAGSVTLGKPTMTHLSETPLLPLSVADPLAPLRVLVANLTTDVTAVAAGIAVLVVAVNGVRYLASGGNPGRQADARAGITAAAAGLAVVLLAGVIVNIVLAAVK